MSVDLPEPEGPVIATNSPGFTARLTLCRMWAHPASLSKAVHVADVDNGTHYMPSSADMLPEPAL